MELSHGPGVDSVVTVPIADGTEVTEVCAMDTWNPPANDPEDQPSTRLRPEVSMGRLLTGVAAVYSAAGGAIHVAVIGAHAEFSPLHGLLLAAAAGLQLGWTVAQASRSSRPVLLAG